MFLEYKVKFEFFFPLFADNLFCDLTPESLESLDKIKQTKQFQKGRHLFSEGDFPCRIYILRKGKAQILFNDKTNDMIISRLIQCDEILGLTEAILNLPYETETRTATPCIVEYIGRDEFIKFLHSEPDVCFRLLRLSCRNLQKKRRYFPS